MSAFGPGVITVIHDPGDELEITRTALAAHDVTRGQITVHPTVGTESPVTLAFDVLSALGVHITETTASEKHIGAANRAYAAAAAWLQAERIEVVIVLRAHLLSSSARAWLGKLALAARLRVVAIWHGRRRPDWAAAFSHAPNLVREHDGLAAVLTGARPRHDVPAPEVGEALPELAAIPRAGLARFRAEANRTLPPAQFAALDAHYRHGLRAGCTWITGHRLTRDLAAPIRRAADTAPAAGAGGTCLGHAQGRARPWPRAFTDLPGLRVFLSDLAVHAPAPAATIARIRGAQAGLMLHGVSLHVPLELACCRGPGLTGTRVDGQVAAAIRREAANPLIATAVAVCAFTGFSPEEVIAAPLSEPARFTDTVDVRDAASEVWLTVCTVPHPARPILMAAGLFQRQILRPTASLIDGVTLAQLRAAAQAAGIDLAAKPDDRDPGPWHARARAWYVGDGLHTPGHAHAPAVLG